MSPGPYLARTHRAKLGTEFKLSLCRLAASRTRLRRPGLRDELPRDSESTAELFWSFSCILVLRARELGPLPPGPGQPPPRQAFSERRPGSELRAASGPSKSAFWRSAFVRISGPGGLGRPPCQLECRGGLGPAIQVDSQSGAAPLTRTRFEFQLYL